MPNVPPRRTNVLWLVRCMALLAIASGSAAQQQGAKVMEGAEMIAMWLYAVDKVPDQAFVPVNDFSRISDGVRGSSARWDRYFLVKEASPYNESLTVKHSVHLATPEAPDLLRHDYWVADLHLVVTETINFTLIDVKGAAAAVLKLPQAERPAAIMPLARRILKIASGDPLWRFQWPARIEDGVHFSSNPDADPWILGSWKERVDGGIRHGDLYFLCFKKYEQISGYQDPKTWYDEDFRARYKRATQIP